MDEVARTVNKKTHVQTQPSAPQRRGDSLPRLSKAHRACENQCQKWRSVLMFVFRFTAALIGLMTMGLYTMTAVSIISQLAYSHLASEPSGAPTLVGFSLIFACFLVTEVTVMLIDAIAVFVKHVAFMVSLLEHWRKYIDWNATAVLPQPTKQRSHFLTNIATNNPTDSSNVSHANTTAEPLVIEVQEHSAGGAEKPSLEIPVLKPLSALSAIEKMQRATISGKLTQQERKEETRRFIAAEHAQCLMDAGMVCALVISIIFGSVLVSPVTPYTNSNGSDTSQLPPNDGTTITQGFETYAKSVAMSCITISSLSMYVGVFAFFVVRAIFGFIFTTRYFIKVITTYKALGRSAWIYLGLLAYIVLWPVLLVALTSTYVVASALARCSGRSVTPPNTATASTCTTAEATAPPAKLPFWQRVVAWVEANYSALLLPTWSDKFARDEATPLFNQKPWKVMLEQAGGIGQPNYEFARQQIRALTAWYIIIWFFGALAYLDTAPIAVAGLGCVGIAGLLVHCLSRDPLRERQRQRTMETEKQAEVADKPADTPAPTPLEKLQVGKQAAAGPKASRDIDLACAWGTWMVALSIVAMWCTFSIFPGVAVFMLLMLLLLGFNWCMPAPNRSLCGSLCRFIIVVIAGVYGAFTNSAGNDAGKLVPLASLNGTVVSQTPLSGYGICDKTIGGLKTLDYCMLSALAYSREDIAKLDVDTWFNAAGLNLTVVEMTRLSNGLRYSAYGYVDASNESYIYVAVRGSRAERDFTQDLFLWQEALLFETLAMFGPYGSYPVRVRQIFIKTIADIGELFQTTSDRTYAASLVDSLRNLQDQHPSSKIILTGHSLGGGLSSFMTQVLGVPSVSFSGPGTVLTGPKLGFDAPSVYGGSIVVVPDYDIVPRIDEHLGTIQNIKCLGSSSAAKCHSCSRTCCELIRSCGDAYGRTLTTCASFY